MYLEGSDFYDSNYFKVYTMDNPKKKEEKKFFYVGKLTIHLIIRKLMHSSLYEFLHRSTKSSIHVWSFIYLFQWLIHSLSFIQPFTYLLIDYLTNHQLTYLFIHLLLIFSIITSLSHSFHFQQTAQYTGHSLSFIQP